MAAISSAGQSTLILVAIVLFSLVTILSLLVFLCLRLVRRRKEHLSEGRRHDLESQDVGRVPQTANSLNPSTPGEPFKGEKFPTPPPVPVSPTEMRSRDVPIRGANGQPVLGSVSKPSASFHAPAQHPSPKPTAKSVRSQVRQARRKAFPPYVSEDPDVWFVSDEEEFVQGEPVVARLPHVVRETANVTVRQI